MYKSIQDKLGFKKIPYGNIYKRDDAILQIITINEETITFTIFEPNLSSNFINSCYEFYTIIYLKYINKFLLLTKWHFQKLTSINLTTKTGIKRYICEYGIFPILEECQTAYIKNKYDDEAYFSTILLDESDVICIIEDELQIKEIKQ